jgi:hypothetical protein
MQGGRVARSEALRRAWDSMKPATIRSSSDGDKPASRIHKVGGMQVDWAKDGGQKNVGAEKFFVRGWDRIVDEHS